MVIFTPDGQYILTADEGEPRAGYGPDAVDPKGSVTVIDLRKGVDKAVSTIVTFDQFDGKYFRLLSNKVIIKTLTDPSRDLEPEYIAITSDSKKAYVSLQEANAIGKTYLLTANEGDAREWGDYANDDKKVIAGFSVDVLKNSAQDDLDHEKAYTFGGRSFPIRVAR